MANQQTKTVTNVQFTLNYRDLLRGILIAVLTAGLTALLDALNVTGGEINWKNIGTVAGVAGISYLLKNFLTPTEIVVSNPPKETVEQVKEGAPIQVAGNYIASKNV